MIVGIVMSLFILVIIAFAVIGAVAVFCNEPFK